MPGPQAAKAMPKLPPSDAVVDTPGVKLEVDSSWVSSAAASDDARRAEVTWASSAAASDDARRVEVTWASSAAGSDDAAAAPPGPEVPPVMLSTDEYEATSQGDPPEALAPLSRATSRVTSQGEDIVYRQTTSLESTATDCSLAHMTDRSLDRPPAATRILRVLPLRLGRLLSEGSQTADVLMPAMVRSIRVDELLSWFGKHLRQTSGKDKDIYFLSESTQSIDDFISHSWHASSYGKICTLMLYYKGKAMTAAGCVSAAAGALAFPVVFLSYGPELAGLTSTACGILGMVTMVVWWPCRGTAFLDKACIRQDDDTAKRQGILHLGVILRHSRNMIVCWDSTYFSRLWCTFEFAARVKLAAEAEEGFDGLTVIPIIYGGMAVTGCIGNFIEITLVRSFVIATGGSATIVLEDGITLEEAIRAAVALAVAVFIVLLPMGRGIHRQMRSIKATAKQLEGFSIKNAECFCCKHDHRHPETRVKLPCDRKPIEASVKQWFGSMEEFDHHVPKLVQPYIVNTAIVPYHYVVFVAFPDLFEAMGIFSWWVQSGQAADGLHMVCYKLMTAFVYLPICCFFAMQLYSLIPDHQDQGVPVRTVTMTVTTAAIAVICGIVCLGERLALVFLGPWYGFLPAVIVYGVPVFFIYHRYAHSQKSYSNLRPRLTLGAARG